MFRDGLNIEVRKARALRCVSPVYFSESRQSRQKTWTNKDIRLAGRRKGRPNNRTLKREDVPTETSTSD